MKNQSNKKHTAINPPIIIPSLLFLAEILPISVLIPGTWLAASVMRRLMLASVSRCSAKLSWTAYAWLSTLSATSWLRSSRARSPSMYSASASAGLAARYAEMSSRTLPSRLARSRASCSVARSRERSRRWSDSLSRSSARLFCLSADEVSVASESSRRPSWAITPSRWGGREGEG